jgi:hypothetical protein
MHKFLPLNLYINNHINSSATYPPAGVFIPNDVILAQIASGLHFDDFQWDRAGVGETMNLVNGDVGGLVFSKCTNLVR